MLVQHSAGWQIWGWTPLVFPLQMPFLQSGLQRDQGHVSAVCLMCVPKVSWDGHGAHLSLAVKIPARRCVRTVAGSHSDNL